jgi:hypothetical protein
VGNSNQSSDSFSDILGDIEAGEASISDYTDELETILPSSLVSSLDAVTEAIGKYASGKISLEAADQVVRRQADLHPNQPIFFHMCSTYAQQRENARETAGYAALTKIKSDRHEETTGESFVEGLDAAFVGLLSKLESMDRNMFTVLTYLGKVGDHLVNHFLVEDILAAESSLRPELLELTLERRDQVMPIILAMLEELFDELDPTEIPPGIVFMLRIAGHLKPREALPVILMALERCINLPLHEAVLALLKTGSLYPDKVSRELRRLVVNPANGEIRLGAIEVMGLLWDKAGNLQFLMDELQELGPDDEYYDDMFTFLSFAIMLSSREEAVRAVTSALERQRDSLDPRTVYLTRKYLKRRDPAKAGIHLQNIANEELTDLLELHPAPRVANMRKTLTLAREEALAKSLLESLPDLSEVEALLKTGEDEPCPCGSGKRFRRCCLEDLVATRKLLLSQAELRIGQNPDA